MILGYEDDDVVLKDTCLPTYSQPGAVGAFIVVWSRPRCILTSRAVRFGSFVREVEKPELRRLMPSQTSHPIGHEELNDACPAYFLMRLDSLDGTIVRSIVSMNRKTFRKVHDRGIGFHESKSR